MMLIIIRKKVEKEGGGSESKIVDENTTALRPLSIYTRLHSPQVNFLVE
jgi:hypothetical protein